MRDRLRRHGPLLLLAVLLPATGVWLLPDYGVSYDEETTRTHGRDVIGYVLRGDPEYKANNERYHPVAFEMLYQAGEFLVSRGAAEPDTRTIYLVRHGLNVLVFALGLLAFFDLSRRTLRSPGWALAATAAVWLHPRIFAHAFFNPKDIPLLAAFAIAMWTLVRFRASGYAAGWGRAHALACALAVSTRIVGLGVPCLTLVAMAADFHSLRNDTARRRALGRSALAYGVCLVGFTLLVWPILWDNPPWRLWDALRFSSRFPSPIRVLYLGEYYVSKDVPWHYLPVWFLVTTPLGMTAFFLAGLFEAFGRMRRGLATYLREHLTEALLLAWLAGPVLAAIALGAALYDGWRHFFFVYPPFALFAAGGARALRARMRNPQAPRATRLAAGTVLLLALASLASSLVFLVRQHPHQQVYFNALLPDYRAAKRNFEMDYWGVSFREGLAWIAAHDSRPRVPVMYHFPVYLNTLFLPRADRERIVLTGDEEAEYFLFNYRGHPAPYAPEEKAVFHVRARGVPILSVYRGETGRRILRELKGAY